MTRTAQISKEKSEIGIDTKGEFTTAPLDYSNLSLDLCTSVVNFHRLSCSNLMMGTGKT